MYQRSSENAGRGVVSKERPGCHHSDKTAVVISNKGAWLAYSSGPVRHANWDLKQTARDATGLIRKAKPGIGNSTARGSVRRCG